MVEINKDTRSELKRRLKKIIEESQVQYGVFTYDSMDLFATLDNVLPREHKSKGTDPSRQLRSILSSMISDEPVSDFSQDCIMNLLFNLDADYVDPDIKPLLSLIENQSSNDLAEFVLEELEKLPTEYVFMVPLSIPLSALMPPDEDIVVVNSQVSIVRVNEEFWRKYPDRRPATLARLGELKIGDLGRNRRSRQFEFNSAVLKISLHGFVPSVGHNGTILEAIATAKAFFGFGLAFALFQDIYYTGADDSKEILTCHNKTGERINHQYFDYGTGRLVQSLDINQIFSSLNYNEQVRFISDRLNRIGFCLGSGEQMRRLRLAGRWFFDCWASTDDVTSYVQAMIVLETLLGDGKADRNAITLGELLRNRCAYLLGDTHEVRNRILSDFKGIYDVRSAIVHNGHDRLSTAERKQLSELKKICADVIRAEGRILERSAKGVVPRGGDSF